MSSHIGHLSDASEVISCSNVPFQGIIEELLEESSYYEETQQVMMDNSNSVVIHHWTDDLSSQRWVLYGKMIVFYFKCSCQFIWVLMSLFLLNKEQNWKRLAVVLIFCVFCVRFQGSQRKEMTKTTSDRRPAFASIWGHKNTVCTQVM